MDIEQTRDIVAVSRNGHVVALATSDGGKSDIAFARNYGSKYRIEMMPIPEAVNRYLTYLKSV